MEEKEEKRNRKIQTGFLFYNLIKVEELKIYSNSKNFKKVEKRTKKEIGKAEEKKKETEKRRED